MVPLRAHPASQLTPPGSQSANRREKGAHESTINNWETEETPAQMHPLDSWSYHCGECCKPGFWKWIKLTCLQVNRLEGLVRRTSMKEFLDGNCTAFAPWRPPPAKRSKPSCASPLPPAKTLGKSCFLRPISHGFCCWFHWYSSKSFGCCQWSSRVVEQNELCQTLFQQRQILMPQEYSPLSFVLSSYGSATFPIEPFCNSSSPDFAVVIALVRLSFQAFQAKKEVVDMNIPPNPSFWPVIFSGAMVIVTSDIRLSRPREVLCAVCTWMSLRCY